ncbi:MAG: exosortase C-terminal domain/associated protein EpsI, partial [Pacificimonas sp.]
ALIADRDADSVTARIAMPDVPGWTRSAATGGSGWRPLYGDASTTGWQSYSDASGRQVDLFIAIYDRQSEEAEMIAYGNGLMEPDGDWSWAQNLTNPAGGRGLQIQRAPWTRDIWQYYLVGGELTGSDYRAKLATLRTKLTGGPTRAATLIATVERSGDLQSGEAALADFMAALGNPADVISASAVSE